MSQYLIVATIKTVGYRYTSNGYVVIPIWSHCYNANLFLECILLVDNQKKLNFREHAVRAGSWEINVAVAGEGQPLVFMHALGGSWRWWLPTMNALPQKYRFYAFDFPGAGKSSKLTHVPTSEEFIGALDELFAKLELPTSSQLIGHSLGAYIGLVYAMVGKTQFQKIVSVAPCGVTKLRTSRSLAWLLRLFAFVPLSSILFSRVLMGSYKYLMPVNDDIVNLLKQDFVSRDTRLSLAYQLINSSKIPLLGQVAQNSGYVHNQEKLPIKLIWGKRDHIFSYRCGYKLSKLLKGVELALLDDSRHWPHFDEPLRFKQELENFLA